MLTAVATAMRCPLCLLLAFLPNVPDGRFLWLELMPAKTAPWPRKVSEVYVGDSPFVAAVDDVNQALYFSVLLVLISVGSTFLSAASKKCPAAVSATLLTGMQMALGYVADVLCALDVNLDGMKPLNTQQNHPGGSETCWEKA